MVITVLAGRGDLVGKTSLVARFSQSEGFEILLGVEGFDEPQCSGNFRFRGTAHMA
jgi:hypothetical protein